MRRLLKSIMIAVLLFSACQKKRRGYALPGLEHGLLQSPINIISSKAKEGHHNITLHYQDKINSIEHKGKSVKIRMEKGNSVTMDGKEYKFAQIHFHTPAEHLIDGITYPLEMHVVNIGGTPSVCDFYTCNNRKT